MKVKALIEFNDLQSKTIRKIGEEFEVSVERVEQINSTSHGTLVEVIGIDDENIESVQEIKEDPVDEIKNDEVDEIKNDEVTAKEAPKINKAAKK